MRKYYHPTSALRYFSFLILTFSLVACNLQGSDQSKDKRSYFIAILNKNIAFNPPGLGYTIASSWPILQNAYPSEMVYKITEEDIDTYNWTSQAIILSPQASKNFIDFFGCNADDRYPVCTELYSFVSVLNDVPIYGGQFIITQSPAAIQFPIIYANMTNSIVTFTIRPFHTLYVIEPNDPAWTIIRNKEIEDIFLKTGKLIK